MLLFVSFNLVASEHGLEPSGHEPSSEIPAKREFPLNEQVKPCENFHQYVCSNVEKSFKLREDRNNHTFSFNDSSERLLEAKKSFFEKIASESNLNPRDLQTRNYFLACMNEKSGEQEEKVGLKKLLFDISQIKSATDFMKFQLTQVKEGKSSLFYFGSGSNKEDPNKHDLVFIADLMNLPEYSYYDNPELMNKYQSLIVDYFKIAEPNGKEIEYLERAKKLISFEREFVKIYPHPEVIRQRWSEKRQESQTLFQKKYPRLDLGSLLSLAPLDLLVSNPIPESLQFVQDKMTDENLAVWKDLYSYSAGIGFLDDSNPAYFAKQFAFNNKFLGGANSRPNRHERCTKSVMGAFNMELDALLVSRLFPNFPEEKVREIAQKIRESIIRGLRANTWLSAGAKKQAIKKIEMAKLYLVKPQTEKEWDFRPIKTYSETNKIENRHLLKKTDFEKQITDLKDPVNLEAWSMGPLTVNAYYSPSANKFVLPIGILQYPFFDASGSFTDNIGSLGAVFAHELGHGIDDEGSKYDETGRLRQWMTRADLKEFNKRSKKMVEQFNRAGHNGSLTLGENVADLVGLTFAYQAAFPDKKGSLQDKQKVFLAWGRVWCNVARPKYIENVLKTNPHSLGWARINEQVKHQKGFSEAFQCSAKSPMSLPDSKRIKIW